MPQILLCTCSHPYQDKLYGQGYRVHNQKKDGNYRCTVCKKEKSASGVVKDKVKDKEKK